MRVRFAIGVILVLIGAVWFGQGIGVIHGSFMTGEAIWAVIGAVVILFGVSILWGGLRERTNRAEDDER